MRGDLGNSPTWHGCFKDAVSFAKLQRKAASRVLAPPDEEQVSAIPCVGSQLGSKSCLPPRVPRADVLYRAGEAMTLVSLFRVTPHLDGTATPSSSAPSRSPPPPSPSGAKGPRTMTAGSTTSAIVGVQVEGTKGRECCVARPVQRDNSGLMVTTMTGSTTDRAGNCGPGRQLLYRTCVAGRRLLSHPMAASRCRFHCIMFGLPVGAAVGSGLTKASLVRYISSGYGRREETAVAVRLNV